ncbi:MAG: glycosyltransferase family 4 protein [Planctomycetes bacterium]|nr:glycosyltransferase family 4 protein [Planctomycetota bacterium]
MTRLRLGFDIQPTLGRPSGIGRYTILLREALRRGFSERFECVGIGADEAASMPTPKRVFWERFRLPKQARAARLDLFHSTGFAAKPGLGVPQVWTLHDLIQMRSPSRMGLVSRWYWTKELPRSVRHADAILADSEATKRDAVDLLGVAPLRVRVVLLAPDPAIGPMDPGSDAQVRARLGIDGPYVLFVGTLEPRKNLPFLVEAFAPVARAVSSLSLVLAGGAGWDQGRIEEAVARHGVRERVKFPGYVGAQALGPLYRGAVCLAFPSLCEGFGLPPLEAMAAGTPAIASDNSSLPEAVGEGGRCLPLGDSAPWSEAIRELAEDPAARARWSARGLAWSSRFSWDRVARETAEAYESLVTR